MIIGVLSDTHSYLHPNLLPVFKEAGVEQILHAGDVGAYGILRELGRLAPVTAVCGNVDVSGNVALLPAEVRLELGGVTIYMTHIGGKPFAWYPQLHEPKPAVAICGHSHIPLLERERETLFLNPGSAGIHTRFGAPLSAAILRVSEGEAEAAIITL